MKSRILNTCFFITSQLLIFTSLFSEITLDEYKKFNESYYQSIEWKQKGWCKLLYALSNNKLEIARYLIEQGDDVNIIAPSTQLGWPLTPFYCAIQRQHAELVKLCVLKGGNLKPLKDFGLISPLHVAVTSSNAEIVEILLSNGANPNCRRHLGRTPLHDWAQRVGISGANWSESLIKEWHSQNYNMLITLLNYQVDINAISEQGISVISTISNTAAQDNPIIHEEIIELLHLLLERGCYVNFDNPSQSRGQQPLSQAIQNTYNSLTVVQILLEYGADPNWNDGYYTPLTWNSIKGSKLLVPILVKGGANLEFEDYQGCTPLIRAILSQNTSIVEALIENGASINNKGRTRKLPLDIAYEQGHQEIIDLILNAQFSNR